MSNRLFVNIYGNVGSNIQDTSTASQTIIKNYVNDIYFDILKRINWQDIDDDYTFSTVAGTKDYVLPSNFGKEVYVFNSSTNVELSSITMQELVKDFASGINSSGDIQRYMIIDRQIRQQPSSASALSIVSTSASDTTQVVRVKGANSLGVELDESVTLTGTTPATTTNTYTEVRSITKSSTTAGYVTVTSNSGAITNAIMAPADLAYLVKVIRLHYTPTSVQTISLPYLIRPKPMVSDYDQPVINCADVIELGATMKAWRYKRQFSKANEYERQYEKAVDTLIWDVENSFNQGHFFGTLPYPRDDY